MSSSPVRRRGQEGAGPLWIWTEAGWYGPFSREELARRVRAGGVLPQTMVRSESGETRRYCDLSPPPRELNWLWSVLTLLVSYAFGPPLSFLRVLFGGLERGELRGMTNPDVRALMYLLAFGASLSALALFVVACDFARKAWRRGPRWGFWLAAVLLAVSAAWSLSQWRDSITFRRDLSTTPARELSNEGGGL